MARTILLLDGDQYLHRACAAVETETRWDDENHLLHSNAVEAWEVLEGSIKKTLQHFDEQDHVVCLSATGTKDFRKDLIDPSYKAHRAGSRKPLCLHDLKAKMIKELDCRWIEGLEADDVMGILATKPGPDKRIIVSRDKDMRSVPTMVWTGERFYNITPDEANYFHLYQTLVGDTADGYKGCPGVGPKTADKILTAAGGINGSRWIAVVTAFLKAGLTEADARRQARLARILRWSDWNPTTKEPILWTP